MNSTTDKLAEVLRECLEEADAGIVATPCTRESARAALAAYEAECSNHPDAPHGFDRNASHNEGRYVCECESWSPPAAPAAPSYLTRDTVVSGVRVIKVWPVGSDEPQILGTTIGGAPAAIAPAWQPIDTAPKDGDVLIYVTETDEQFVAYWDDCWRFAPNAKLKTPTHWMPLPAAPEAGKKEKA
jgi:hypothetical protein